MLWVISTSTLARVDCGVEPCSMPTNTPGATYLPPLTEGVVVVVPDVVCCDGLTPAALTCGRVVFCESAELVPTFRRSRPSDVRRRSSRPGSPLARLRAATASCTPSAGVIWPASRPKRTRDRTSSCGNCGEEVT